MVKESGVVMAFDFGLKNIGIAIGQNITKSASTFYAIKAKGGVPDWIRLDSLIEEWEPNLFVVGDPFNMDGTKSEFQKKIAKFSTELKNRYGIELQMIDERLTTKEAKEIYQKLLVDPKTSSGIRQRSQAIMLTLQN